MGMLPKPLSNEELAAIRRKAQAPQQVNTAPATAAEVAYESGIKVLGPVVARIEKLEAQVKELQEALAAAAKNGAEIKALLEAAAAPAVKPVVSTSTSKQH